ncbi:hypothetical protein Daus18300_008570 [Diaporthe australafricana]|uniref:Zn(2)-C6 fungal-type domain-containing protein n=1 Tax=Diaporthe australafricana TaxID=127596 RepID=A0ABR3WHM5_9PEZI
MSPSAPTGSQQAKNHPSIDDLLETHKPLFRRRKASHLTHPPPPCLSCSLKKMPCIVYAGMRCQRCERNGEEVCVRQKEDLTKPEEAEKAEESGGDGEGTVTHRTRRAGRRAPPLECMVFSLDPAFQRDKRRLLGIAAEMLAGPTAYVLGTPVRLAQTKNFALPVWHQNDKGESTARRAVIAQEIRVLREKEELNQQRKAEERRLAKAKQNESAGLSQQD